MRQFDMIVIGAGIGLTLVEAAVRNNQTCALIEQSKFGGTCLTKGCIPSKVLVSVADTIREMEHAGKTGVNFGTVHTNWSRVASRMWSQIDISKDIEKELFDTKGVTVFKGTARFTGVNTLRVSGFDGRDAEEITSGRIIVAPGARTFIPPVEGLEQTGYLTSESFFSDQFPQTLMKRIVLLGAGAIGAEFAHVFSAMGVHVTMVEKKDRILPLEEECISSFVRDNFIDNGIDVRTSTSLLKAITGNGEKILTLQDDLSGVISDISCDEIFVATGIRSNSDVLELAKAGVEMDAKGWVVTNGYLETNRPGIYALGDINGKYQFRHKANYEGEILSHNLFKPDEVRRIADYRTVPWAIFTYPQVAHVGLTEREALVKHGKILVGIKHYSSIAKGFAMGYEKGDRDDGFVKIILDYEHKILGAHIAGPEASLLIQPYVYLMNAGGSCVMSHERSASGALQSMNGAYCEPGGTTNPITQSMVIHPALSELTAWVLEEMRPVEL